VQYTSVAWGASPVRARLRVVLPRGSLSQRGWRLQASSKAGKRRRSRKDLGQLALGTQQGTVVVWNLSTAEMTQQLGTVRACCDWDAACPHVTFFFFFCCCVRAP